uniref:Uncharacterized protein n=1 Tax=Anguilla anguilla TaxID=7936 RepID=A0A0E9SR63_ANGAN
MTLNRVRYDVFGRRGGKLQKCTGRLLNKM